MKMTAGSDVAKPGENSRGIPRLRVTATQWIGLAVILGLIIFPLLGSTYSKSIMTTILIYGVYAMSLDLLMGYTGLPSFGHAAFFGLGAYAVGLVSLHVSNSLWVTLPTAMAVSALAATIIGFLAVRSTGVYFLMLTLAFAQLLYAFFVSRMGEFAGGANGLPGIPRPNMAPLPDVISFQGREEFYYLTLVFFMVGLYFLAWVVRSPLGQSLIGIRENEARMRALGYVTWRYKLAAFTIAGLVSGAAGGFFAHQRGFASPELLFWTTSGLALLMVIIGGTGTLVGPALGAALFVIVQDYVSSFTERWQLIFGLVFVVSVYAMRDGIVGLARRFRKKLL